MRAKVNIISELTNISKKLSLCKKQKFQTTTFSHSDFLIVILQQITYDSIVKPIVFLFLFEIR